MPERVAPTIDVHLNMDELEVTQAALSQVHTADRILATWTNRVARFAFDKIATAKERLDSATKAEAEFRASLTQDELEIIRERRLQMSSGKSVFIMKCGHLDGAHPHHVNFMKEQAEQSGQRLCTLGWPL